MARERVDGHDVFAMHSAISAATKRVREQQQPMLIEAKTYRYRGHSMADPGKYRNKEEIEKWRIRDPISTLAAVLDAANLEAARKALEVEIEDEIEDAVQYAENSPFPAADSALDYVYV
jgi:pyruvate dehydrogenase E1 component alpha subunit